MFARSSPIDHNKAFNNKFAIFLISDHPLCQQKIFHFLISLSQFQFRITHMMRAFFGLFQINLVEYSASFCFV